MQGDQALVFGPAIAAVMGDAETGVDARWHPYTKAESPRNITKNIGINGCRDVCRYDDTCR